MKWLRRASSEPLWKEEFSVHAGDERYVTRRQLTKFLVLTSLGMFVGNIWILVRSLFYKTPSYPQQAVARLGEIPVGGVKLFTYPSKEDRCIMVRTGERRVRELQPEMHPPLLCSLLFAGKQSARMPLPSRLLLNQRRCRSARPSITAIASHRSRNAR